MSPAQGHPGPWAPCSLWHRDIRAGVRQGPGQVLSGLGWAAFSNFSIHPGHAAPLRVLGCVPCAVDGQTDECQTAARILSSPCSRSAQTRVQGGPRPARPLIPPQSGAALSWPGPAPRAGGAAGDAHRRCSFLWGRHDARDVKFQAGPQWVETVSVYVTHSAP